MSMLEGLSATLSDMGFTQLALMFLAVGAYSIAINSAYSGASRSGAASVAFAAAVGFAALTPLWMGGVVFLALTVVAVAGFAAAAWGVSALLRLGADRGPLPVIESAEEAQPAPARAAVPQAIRAWLASAIRVPL